MSFAWPAAFVGLLLIPAAVALHLWMQRRRMRFAVRYPNLELLAGVVESSPPWRRHVPAALYLLALSALLLGFARPQATVLVPRERATVVLTLDTSGSMRATDVEPSRLAAAQSSARSFIDQLPEKFQVGLITFSDQAQILAQPTIDRVAVHEAIDSLRAEGATAMGDAVIASLRLNRRELSRAERGNTPSPSPSPSATAPGRSERPSSERRTEPKLDAILLLSDGYNTSGAVEPLEAASRARDLGIPVYTIALGTPEGVVQAPDAFGQMRLVQVPPDYDTLEAVAERTGGEFFSAPSEDDLRRIYEALGSRIGFVEDREEVTYAFAAAGLLLAFAGMACAALFSGRLP